MSKPNISLSKALLLAKDACCSGGCEYDTRNCPIFWHKAFVLYFGEKPVGVKLPNGDDDPRWDIILKLKYKRLTLLLKWRERELDLQKAAE